MASARKPLKNSHLQASVASRPQQSAAAAVPWCLRRDADLLLRLAVVPRSAREGFDGEHGGRLRLRVASPPVDDAANERVVELLAQLIGVPRRCIRIVRGARSRAKDVLVRDAGALEPRIAAAGGISAAVAQRSDASAGGCTRKP